MYGKRWVSFIYDDNQHRKGIGGRRKKLERTSSIRLGRIFRVRSPSEKLGNTPVSPFINAIFSSRVLEANVDRSRKLSVDIAKEEKKGYVGKLVGPGRD